MRHLAQCAIALAFLLLVAAVVLAGVAIWTVGPDSGRLGGTVFLLIVVAVPVGLGGAHWLTTHQAGAR